MFTDIVFPAENEKEFIELAERLSIGGLCLCYSYEPKRDYKEILARIKKLQEGTRIRLSFGLMARPNDSMKARQLADLLVVRAMPTADNRPTMEKKEIDLIFELEGSPKKDPMHYRYSGMNQVQCVIAKESEMIIGFSFSMLLNSERLRRSVLMGRFNQNIRLCRKYNTNAAFASFAKEPFELRAGHEMLSLARTLGMTPGDANAAIGIVSKRLEENMLRRQGKYFGQGIEVIDKPRA